MVGETAEYSLQFLKCNANGSKQQIVIQNRNEKDKEEAQPEQQYGSKQMSIRYMGKRGCR